ncbi:MAG: threonine-phosphate decarboxylase CobD [Propionivibrio sp.]
MLEHGGRLRLAARHYEIPLDEWLDLSTGINPESYPVAPIDPSCWQRLPEDDDGLDAAAAAHYGNDRLLVLPGSQAAIQALPALFDVSDAACVAPLYEEHPHAWERAGHALRRLPTLADALASGAPNVFLCNPNNPTATTHSRVELIAAAKQLRLRDGWLIVDEAFADAEPEHSVTTLAGSDAAPNLIVLRSLGKFYGLAGARVGFLFGDSGKLGRLREMIGPWAVANPSRAAARQALTDTAWQKTTRAKLAARSRRLADLLSPLGKIGRTALFCTVSTPYVAEQATHFARCAILTRRFEPHGLLRFGLPGSEVEWARLSVAVAEWVPPDAQRLAPVKQHFQAA